MASHTGKAGKKRPGGHPARTGAAEDAREARRAKAAALREREAARARRRRVLLVSLAVVVVAALVAVVAVLVVHQRDESARESAAASSTTGPTPPGTTGEAGGYVLPGTPAAGAPTLDVWVDYQCPVCARFEALSGDAVVQLAADGRARVVVHTVSFLDDNFGNDASQRAAEGAAAAAAQGRFAQWNTTVFANQPEQEGDGYTDADLRSFAEQAGVPDLDAWQRAQDEHTYAGFAHRVEAAREGQQVSGTPTVRLTSADGAVRVLSDQDDGSLQQLLGSGSAAWLQQQVAAATQ